MCIINCIYLIIYLHHLRWDVSLFCMRINPRICKPRQAYKLFSFVYFNFHEKWKKKSWNYFHFICLFQLIKTQHAFKFLIFKWQKISFLNLDPLFLQLAFCVCMWMYICSLIYEKFLKWPYAIKTRSVIETPNLALTKISASFFPFTVKRY